MDIVIKQIELDDTQNLLLYQQKLLLGEGHNAPFAPGEFCRTFDEQRIIVENYLKQENSVCFLACQEDAVVGEINCKGFNRLPLKHVTVLSMSVDIDYRGKGIGTRLMQVALKWAVDNPLIKRIELYTFANNKTAHSLYRKFGFEVEGIRKQFVRIDDEYIDDIIMAKLL